MYSLGEVIGPFLGGVFLENFGFPIATTIMASLTFTLVRIYTKKYSPRFLDHYCIFQAILTLIFFTLKEQKQLDYEKISDSGISASWNSTSSFDMEASEISETQPMIHKNSDHHLYTLEKVMYYEQSRKQDQQVCIWNFIRSVLYIFVFFQEGEHDNNQVTDVRGTVFITASGACEV